MFERETSLSVYRICVFL